MEGQIVKKLDNKGLSLVELIIAIAMSTIVVGAASMFLYSANKSYHTAEYSIDLQMEAQLLMEQMSNWVMDSNYITYGGTSPSNYLVLYNFKRPKLDSSTLNEVAQKADRIIIYMANDKLYMKKSTETIPGEYQNEVENTALFDTSFLTEDPLDVECIGEYTKSFTVKLPNGMDPKKINSVIIELGMYEGVTGQSKSYEVSNRFSLRNSMRDIEVE
jgi:hypothetical protein